MTSVVIKPSTKSDKKLMAVFTMPDGKTKTTHFGQKGADDFTKTKNKSQKERYLNRHRARERWDDPFTAGALSRWILWNLPTRTASIKDFKRRFKFK